MPQLRRLFTVKSGLGFWYTGSAADELVSPVDVCNTEETFQAERRPMEIALTVLAQSCGVEIRSGTGVSTGRSRLDGPDPMLVMRGSPEAVPGLRGEILVRLEQISVLMLLPIYFVVAGLSINLSTIGHSGLDDV